MPKNTPANKRQYEQNESAPHSDWLERLANFNLHFGRFLRDSIGVLLIAFALMFMLAMWSFTTGTLLTPIANFINLWFGWGGFLIPLGMGYFGFSLLRRDGSDIHWGRIISLEVASLLTLGLLAVFGSNDLARAEAGMDGGRLGWGLITLAWNSLTKVGGTIVISLLWAFTVMIGFGLWEKLEAWLLTFAGEAPPVIVTTQVPAETENKSEQPARSVTSKKKTQPIPEEFRTSFKSSEKADEKSVKAPPRAEELPPLSILLAESAVRADDRTINQTAGLIMKTLAEFGIPATVIGYRVGPSVTQFAVQPGFIKKPGSDEEDAQQMKVRVAQIASLEKDIALALSAQRLRIEAPVPGKPYVGIEVPNTHSSVVRLKTILESEAFFKVGAPLTVAIGRDVSGHPLIADLARMPHLLIAGATGSGKSVCITSIAACLAMSNAPEDLRMVMIDSKMVELIRFNGLPHLYGKVETNIERILGVLKWVVVEMEHRYRLLESRMPAIWMPTTARSHAKRMAKRCRASLS